MTDQEICEWLSVQLKTEITDMRKAFQIMMFLTNEVEDARKKYNIPPNQSLTEFVIALKNKNEELRAKLEALKGTGRTEPESSKKSGDDTAS